MPYEKCLATKVGVLSLPGMTFKVTSHPRMTFSVKGDLSPVMTSIQR